MEESIGIPWTEPALGMGWLCKNLETVLPAKTGEDRWIFFHQKTFPLGHQLNIVVPCSSPVFFGTSDVPYVGSQTQKKVLGWSAYQI